MERSFRSQSHHERPSEINSQGAETPIWRGLSATAPPPVQRTSYTSGGSIHSNYQLASPINVRRIITTVRSNSAELPDELNRECVQFIRPSNQCAMRLSSPNLLPYSHSSTSTRTAMLRPRIVEVRSWIQPDQSIFQCYRYADTETLLPQTQRSPGASHLNQPEVASSSRTITPVRLNSGILEQSSSALTNWQCSSCDPSKIGLRFIRPPSTFHGATRSDAGTEYHGNACRRSTPIPNTLKVQPDQTISEPCLYTDMMLKDTCVLRESPVRSRGRPPLSSVSQEEGGAPSTRRCGRPPLPRSLIPAQLPYAEPPVKVVSKTPIIRKRGRPPLSRISQDEDTPLLRGPGKPPLPISVIPALLPYAEPPVQEVSKTPIIRRRGRPPFSRVNQGEGNIPSIRRFSRLSSSGPVDYQQPHRDDDFLIEESLRVREILPLSRSSLPARLNLNEENSQQELFGTKSIRELRRSLPSRLMSTDFTRKYTPGTTSLQGRGKPPYLMPLSEGTLSVDESFSRQVSEGVPVKRKRSRPSHLSALSQDQNISVQGPARGPVNGKRGRKPLLEKSQQQTSGRRRRESSIISQSSSSSPSSSTGQEFSRESFITRRGRVSKQPGGLDPDQILQPPLERAAQASQCTVEDAEGLSQQKSREGSINSLPNALKQNQILLNNKEENMNVERANEITAAGSKADGLDSQQDSKRSSVQVYEEANPEEDEEQVKTDTSANDPENYQVENQESAAEVDEESPN